MKTAFRMVVDAIGLVLLVAICYGLVILTAVLLEEVT